MAEDVTDTTWLNYLWGVLRLGMGWIFFWAFLDKWLGLGFATKPSEAWIAGGSPTANFLRFATKGPFAHFYRSLAGNVVVDGLFMLGLLFVGITLLLGILVRLGSYVGVLMLILIYTAGSIPPEHNPFLDEHVIYAVVLVGLSLSGSGRYLGLGRWWTRLEKVKRHPLLE